MIKRSRGFLIIMILLVSIVAFMPTAYAASGFSKSSDTIALGQAYNISYVTGYSSNQRTYAHINVYDSKWKLVLSKDFEYSGMYTTIRTSFLPLATGTYTIQGYCLIIVNGMRVTQTRVQEMTLKVINEIDITTTTVDPVEDQVYTGSEIKPSLTIKNGDTTLTEGTDYEVSFINNKDVGEATAIIKGIGVYVNTMEVKFNITTRPIKDATIEPIPDQVYTGKKIKPALTVKYGCSILTENTDYTVSFSENKNIGEAKITITGINGNEGSKSTSFYIIPKAPKLSSAKSESKKQLTVKWKTDKNASGYEIQYSLNKDFSDAKTKSVKNGSDSEYLLKKLKSKKTYYVRIRTFSKVGKKKLYSSWSNVKKGKTK